MNKPQLYSEAKTQAQELGYDTAELRKKWVGSTKAYWQAQIVKYTRNIKNRRTNYNKATKLARELQENLQRPNALTGSANEDWIKESRRLRKIKQQQTKQRAAAAVVLEQQQAQRQAQQQRTQLRTNTIKEQLQAATTKKLIKSNSFQKIFDNAVDHGITLSNAQAEQVYNNIFGAGRYTMSVEGTGGFRQDLPINTTSRAFVLNILSNGLTIAEDVDSFGSDIINVIDITSIYKIKLSKLKPTHIIKNRDGQFFPHLNTTEINLVRYQIFNQEQAYDESTHKGREHCLIHTLAQQGVDKATLNNIKLSYVAGVNIGKKDLKNIAIKINRDIHIYTRSSDRTVTQKIKIPPITRPKGDTINIAIYENHYFTQEDTQYSTYSINNYNNVKELEDFQNIIKIQKTNKNDCITRDETKSKCNSLTLVDKFFNQGKFKKLDLSKFEESARHIQTRDHIHLENIDLEQQECKRIMDEKDIPDSVIINQIKPEDIPKIYYADCETFVSLLNKALQPQNHTLYLLGVVGDESDCVNLYNVMDNRFTPSENCDSAQKVVKQFLHELTSGGKSNALCYFHNLKYDYNIMEKYLPIKSRCEKDGQLYSVKCTYKGKEIEFRDSYKILPFPLSKFGDEFDLPQEIRKKEAIAYSYYTKENNNEICSILEYNALLSVDEQLIFLKQVQNEPSYNHKDQTFNPLEYYKSYLRLDCLVLKKGIQKFNTLIKQITEGKMSVYGCLTISSLTDKYMTIEGAYDNVYEMSGNLRAYVAEAVYGGRVSVNEKYKKKAITGKIADYDGVSLYPSAINRLCREIGLPTGTAQRLTPEQLSAGGRVGDAVPLYSVMTVKITKVNKTQQMPFIAQKNKDSIKYINTPPQNPDGSLKPIIIDSITLADYIKFHDIEYEILDGVYWNEETNKKMGEVIQRLFKARLQYKKTNKALANTIKLMLNSSYGKTIMKKAKQEKVIVKTHKWKMIDGKITKFENASIDNYIYNNFNTIKSYRALNAECYEIERIKADDSYNRGHIGCAILSMSKRIMNEVFDIANTEEYPIYYTDTDSLHLKCEDVPKLETEYKRIYNKELNGTQLEQFHTDFNMLDKDGNARQGKDEEIYATKSIFLGKKSYLDCLESKDKNGKTITGYHIRLKGITTEGLEDQAKKYDKSYEGLYEELATTTTGIKFTLNPYNPDENKQKVLFEYKNGNVSFKPNNAFIRNVKF